MIFSKKNFGKRTYLIIILLILAIIIGTVVRVWKITSLPFPPNGDELAFGYYGWSLLHFQTDEYGNFLPFYFPSVGDYKYPVLGYLNILPAIFFGLSEIIARFWSVFSGIILIPLTFLLSRLIFKSNIAALVSAYLISLSPWGISLSRYGYENNVAVSLTIAAFICLLLLVKSHSRKIYLIISFVLFLTSTFTYGSQKVFIPSFLLILLISSQFKNSPLYSIKRILFLFFLLLTIITAISLVPWQSRGRASGVLYSFTTPEQINQLEELKIEAGISPVHIPVRLTQGFHNKIRISALEFLERYSNHFSPSFLFFKGESGAVERIPLVGQLLLIEILLLPFGLMTLLINPLIRKSSLMILFWLLAAPVASALTIGEPHINRASIMIPSLALISGFGFEQILSLLKGYQKVIVLTLLIFGIIFSSLFVLNQLFVHKVVAKFWIREQVNKLMVDDIFKVKDRYQAVVISKTDNEYMFFLFYKKISPKEFIKNASITKESRDNQWRRVDKLYNIYFKMPYDCPKSGKLNVLYICTGTNVPQNALVLKVIRFLDNVPAYTFVEFYPISQMPQTLPSLPEGLKYMVDIEKSPNSPDGIIAEEEKRFW